MNIVRVACPIHSVRILDLDGPEPMCGDCRVTPLNTFRGHVRHLPLWLDGLLFYGSWALDWLFDLDERRARRRR